MLGIYVNTIDNSYLNYCIFNCLNNLSQDMKCILYFNNIESLMYENNFDIEPYSNQKHFIISTCINTAKVSDYFYVWDLEWIRKNVDINIYHNKNLITRSKEMLEEIFLVSGNKSEIIPNFNSYLIRKYYDRFNRS